jgi:type II secretory pathway component GspD/PulD (secretin)
MFANRLLLLGAAATLLTSPTAAVRADDGAAAKAAAMRIRLRFVDTDVSDVLQAISLRSHANIVFPAQLKKPISLDITATSVAEALSYTTAAAGLVYRQIGKTFVVGTPDDLRRLIEPFGQTEMLPLATMSPDDAVKLLTGALPYLTVRPAGSQVMVIGTPDDITQARLLLVQQEKLSPQDPQTSEVVMISNQPAPQVATLLKSMYSALKVEAVGGAELRGGAIGISGPKSQVMSAKEMVQRLDAGDTGITKTYRVVLLRYIKTSSVISFLIKAMPTITAYSTPETVHPKNPAFSIIGTQLTGSTGASPSGGGGAGGGSGSPGGGAPGGSGGASGSAAPDAANVMTIDNDHSHSIILSGSQADIDAAVKLLAEIDVPPPQVMVDVRVVDTSPEVASNIGLTWSWSNLDILQYPSGTGINGTHTDANSPFSVPARIGTFSMGALAFQGVLNALVQKNEAKILADPRVQVIDTEDASIFIGNTLRSIVSLSSLSGTTTSVVEFPVGIILLVRPRITDDGKITMRVHPVVSTVTGFDSNNLPQTSTREAETTVRVRDGETVVIGGLIQDQETKEIQEVPLLSKLPLIGQLFRNRSTDHQHSDIMVFITPHVIKDDHGVAVPSPAPVASTGKAHD